MKTIPHIAAKTRADSISAVPRNPPLKQQRTTTRSYPHVSETPETIQARATSVTIVLQKIMAREMDYPHPHGGINE